MKELIDFLPIMKVLFQRTKQSTFIHITTLAFQHMLCFRICHPGIDNLKIIFRKNNYPLNFIDFCIKSFQ